MMIQRVQLLSWFGLLVVCPPLISASCYTCGSKATVLSHWPNNFNAEFSIPITSKVSGGWKVALKFSKPVIDVKIWNADVESTNSMMTLYILKNKHWNANLLPGYLLQMDFNAMFVEPMPEFTVRLIGQEDCGTCAGDPNKPDKATPPPDKATPPSMDDATSAWSGSTSLAPTTPEYSAAAPPGDETTPALPDDQTTPAALPENTTPAPPDDEDDETTLALPDNTTPAPPDDETTPDLPDNTTPAPHDDETTTYLPDNTTPAPPDDETTPDLPDNTTPAPPDDETTPYLPDNTTPAPHDDETTPDLPDNTTPAPPDETTPDLPDNTTPAPHDNETTPDLPDNTTPAPPDDETLGCSTCCSSTKVLYEWNGWNFGGEFIVLIKNEVVGGWVLEIVFSEPITYLEVYDSTIVGSANGGTIYRLKSKPYMDYLAAGTYLRQTFMATTSVQSAPSFTVHMGGQLECCEPEEPGSCVAPTTEAPPFFDCPATEVKYVWQGGFRGKFWIPIRKEVVGGWTIRLDFSEEILYLEPFRADIDSVSNNNKTFFLKNKDYNANQAVGTMMIEQFRASVETTPTFTAVMIGQPSCAPSTTPSYQDGQKFAREGKRQVLSMLPRGWGKRGL